MTRDASPAADAATTILEALDVTVREAVAKTAARTGGGRDIDACQVQSERVAYLATEVEAARALHTYARELAASGARDPVTDDMALVFASEVASRAGAQIDAHLADFGIDASFLSDTLGSPAVRTAIREGVRDERIASIGRQQLATRGVNNCPIDEIAAMARDSVRQFAATEVAADRGAHPPPRRPRARRAHQQDGRARLLRHGGPRGVRRRRHGQPA